MTIKSDRWIQEMSTGSGYLYFTAKDSGLGHQSNANQIPDEYRLQAAKLPVLGSITLPNGDTFRKITNHDMIYPFVPESENEIEYRGSKIKVPSYGLSSYGYDIRLGRNFKVMHGKKTAGYSPVNSIIDFAKNDTEQLFTEYNDVDSIDLLPHSFMLGVSMEHINVPRNMMVTCMGKSTVARKGCSAFITPLESSWSGHITLEIKNDTDYPMRLYAGMGIMQLMFYESDEECMTSYKDRNGKYQDQPYTPVVSKV